MTRDITHDEKWHRLKSPKTADDYAVRMTAEEVSKVPEAAQALSQFMPYIVSVYRSGARREFYGVCVSSVAMNQGLANAAADPEYMARQQEAMWRDHLARVERLRLMAVCAIKRQPFFR